MKKIISQILALAICLSSLGSLSVKADVSNYSQDITKEKPTSAWASTHAVYERNNGNMALVKSSDNTERTYTLDKEAGIGKQWHLFSGERFISAAGKDGDSGRNVDKFEKGKTYVYQVGVKNLNPEVDAYYGIAYLKKDSYNFDDGVASNYYGIDGMKVTATDEYQLFQDTITIGADWDDTKEFTQSMHQGLGYKSPLNASIQVNVGTAYRYFAEEAPYAIRVSSENDSAVLDLSGTLNLTATVLNQIEIPGTLNQSVRWVVMDEGRTEEVDTITVTGTNNATVSCGSGAEEGSYCAVAVSDDYELVTGFAFEVVESLAGKYADTAPAEKPASVWTGAAALHGLNDGNYIIVNPSGDTTRGYEMKSGKTAQWNVFGGQTLLSKAADANATNLEKYEAGKTYVYQVGVKKDTADKTAYYGIGYPKTSEYSVVGSDKYGQTGMEVTATDDYQLFRDTITFPDSWDGTDKASANWQKLHQGLGYNSDVSAKITVNIAEEYRYFAEEAFYDITNTVTGGDAKIVKDSGDSVTLKAEVLNQIEIPGKLSQDIEWVALSSDRTEIINTIQITEGTDGTATVTAENAPAGTYVIAARSDTYNAVQGVTVTVEEKPVMTITLGIDTATTDKASLTATVTNPDGNLATFYIAAYEADGRLKSVKMENVTVTSQNVAFTDMTLENLTGGMTVKAFVWKDMKPTGNSGESVNIADT